MWVTFSCSSKALFALYHSFEHIEISAWLQVLKCLMPDEKVNNDINDNKMCLYSTYKKCLHNKDMEEGQNRR